MKLKYYLSDKIMKYLMIIFIIIIFTIQMSSGYTLDSSGALPNKIFKCQPSTISGNFTGAITFANVWINSSTSVMWEGSFQTNQTNLTLTNNGAGLWSVTYGNYNKTLYGNKTITFEVTTSDGTFKNDTNTWVFVYSDACTGTGITNYTQVNTGFRNFGNYTSLLWSNPNYTLIDLSLEPWIDYWGYFFYLFIIGLAMTTTYQKSQNIWQPLIIAITGLATLTTTTAIPDEFRNYILLMLGVMFGGIIYKLTYGR